MESTDPSQFLLGCAAISWAAASAALFCRGNRAQKPLAACLMAGAMLATADAMSPANIALPLGAILIALGAGALAWSAPLQAGTPKTSPSAKSYITAGHDQEAAHHTDQPTPDCAPSEAPSSAHNDESTAVEIASAPAEGDTNRGLLGLSPAELPTSQAQVEGEPTGLTTSDVMRNLRNPLTSVVAAMQLADPGEDNLSQPNAPAMMQLRTYSRQLSTAMADIEDLEALLHGEVDLADDVFNLQLLLRNCLAEVTPQTIEREVDIRYDASASLPQWVRGDPSRVRQLCSRVLQIATHRCTLGPVDICAASDNAHIHISLLNVHTDIEEHDGLGAVFARELARTMGGSLNITPRDNGGTEFSIKLPKELAPDWEIELLAEDAAATEQARPLASHRVSGNVLLITSNSDHQQLLSQIVGKTGAEVTTAGNRELAIAMLQEQAFDLLLLDMQGDGEDGLKTARIIRGQGAVVPIIALTSHGSQTFLEQCLVAGCNGHLQKPIDTDMLQGALAMHLATAE